MFCYVCGEYTLQSNRRGISEFVKRAYVAYFKVLLGDQDKAWAPHIVCKKSVEHLRQWTKKERKSLHFGIPMAWREPKNHLNDCYFCAVNTKESTGRTGIHWFIQISSLQLGQFHTAVKFLLQYLKACLNWNYLAQKKTKPPFFPLTVVTVLFQMSISLLLHCHSFSLKENLMI